MANLSRDILDLDGNPMPDGAGQNATIAKACVSALLTPVAGNERGGPEEKVRRFMLAQRIVTSPEIDLTAEETALIKQAVGHAYPPLVVGRVFEAIDPASVK